jgi:hypothetical protein
MNVISQFWNWFIKNSDAYTFLDSVDQKMKDKLLSDFLDHLHLFCDNLYFEIGGFPDEDKELIITAEGKSEYFGEVEELIKLAPQIAGWRFIAFKQPTEGHFISNWKGLQLNTEEMWFLPLEGEHATDIGIRIYLKNNDLVRDNELLTPLLYKMLDTILGEKSFATDIKYVDTDLQPDDPEEDGMYPIIELPGYISWFKSEIQKENQ